MTAEAYMLIFGIILLASVYVLLPVALYVHKRYRERAALVCPETGRLTSVQIDAARAARTSLFGRPSLRVADCARWPERKDCARLCVAGRN